MAKHPSPVFTPGRIILLTFLLGTMVCFFAPDLHAATRQNHIWDSRANPAPSRQQVRHMIIEEARRQRFSPALALAVAKTESGFQAHAESPVGARGVMQIMPRTGRTVLGLHPDDLWDARTNIRGGITFLKDLIRTYDGRVDIALSHYNGGSAVRQKNGNLRVIPATRNYVKKVRRLEREYRRDNTMIATKNHPRNRQQSQSLDIRQDRGDIIVRASRGKSLKYLRRKTARTGQKLDRLDRQLDRISRLLAEPRRGSRHKSELHDW